MPGPASRLRNDDMRRKGFKPRPVKGHTRCGRSKADPNANSVRPTIHPCHSVPATHSFVPIWPYEGHARPLELDAKSVHFGECCCTFGQGNSTCLLSRRPLPMLAAHVGSKSQRSSLVRPQPSQVVTQLSLNRLALASPAANSAYFVRLNSANGGRNQRYQTH